MSYKIDIVDMKGKKVKGISLPSTIFANDLVNEGLIHEYVVMYLANRRQSPAHTKTRSEVQRSGRKLYRQKGTGRARVGDAGSPIRRKGGVAMGPRNEKNYSKAMPQKMKNKALCGALTLKAKNKSVVALDAYDSKEIKTKIASTTLSNVGLASTKTLLVVATHDDLVHKSFANIPHVQYTTSLQLNAYDVMTNKNLLFVGEAMKVLEDRLKNK